MSIFLLPLLLSRENSNRYRSAVINVASRASFDARGFMQTVTDTAGSFKVPNPPFMFADGSVGVSASVSRVGEHTREVLCGIDGITESAVDELVAAGLAVAATD